MINVKFLLIKKRWLTVPAITICS